MQLIAVQIYYLLYDGKSRLSLHHIYSKCPRCH